MPAISKDIFLGLEPLPVRPGDGNPNGLVAIRRVWSLWALHKFLLDFFVDRMLSLVTIQIVDWSKPEAKDEVIRDLTRVLTQCKLLDLPGCAEKAQRAIDYTYQHFDQKEGVIALANDLLADIQATLEKQEFIFIRRDRCGFIDNNNLFGETVADVLKSAIPDIRESGNCLAVECHTAAVFHLMRAAEHGLRALAKRVRVRLMHGGKHHPIEYADWDKVINAIKNKLASVRQMSPGPKKQAQLELYSDAAEHCLFMKDIWRNNVSHTRSPYAREESVMVFERVRGFMVSVATMLSKP